MTRSFWYLNVKDFGAVGDGRTNDTIAIQTALNTAENNSGGIVYSRQVFIQ